jgi:hypothetical protein
MKILDELGKGFTMFASSMFSYFENTHVLNSINIKSFLWEFGDDYGKEQESIGVRLTNGKNLFGVKLESYSNAQMDFLDFVNLKQQYQGEVDAKILHCYVKHDDWQGIYLFTTNERIAIQISEYYRIKRMNGNDILEALLDIYFVNYHYIKDKRIVSAYNNATKEGVVDFEIDVMYNKFKDMVATGSRKILKEYKVYQGYKLFPKEDRNINKVFRMDWKGVIFFMFDLYVKSLQGSITIMKNKCQLNDKYSYNKLKLLEEKVRDNQVDAVVLNCVAYLDNDAILSSLSNELGIDFVENLINHYKVIPKTPLFLRDADFDMFIESKYVADIMTCVHRKPVALKKEGLPIVPDFGGYDINGKYTSYYLGEFTGPHAFIFAKTGTGKSVFLQKLLVDIIDLDIDEEVIRALKGKKFRYLDMGESGRKLSYKIKELTPTKEKKNIIISEETGDTFRYSLLEFNVGGDGFPLKDEVSFSIAFMSLVLQVNNEKEITAGEESLIKRVIDQLYLDRNYTYLTLSELSNRGYKDIVDEILSIKDENNESKYALTDLTKNIEEEGYGYLKVPPLRDLIDDLKKIKNRPETSDNQALDVDSAVKKLETIETQKIYNYYSNNILIECDFFYRDFARLKEENEKLFVQLFWIIFKIYFKMDTINAFDQRKRGERITPKYYFIEEVHNFFRYESFEKMLDVASREARKAGIRLLLVSQNPEDVPRGIFKNIPIRICLTNPEDRSEMRQGLVDAFNPTKESLQVFDQIVRFQAALFDDVGCEGLKQEISEAELELFSTTA